MEKTIKTRDISIIVKEEIFKDSERLFQNAYELAKQISESKEKSIFLMETTISLVSQFTGIPELNVQNELVKMINSLIGENETKENDFPIKTHAKKLTN